MNTNLTRLIRLLAAAASLGPVATSPGAALPPKPNIVVVIADQWRAQAFGFAGDPNVKTPNFDRLAAESVWFVNAVSGLPVCSPARASLLTGQRPLTHGVFLNDVPLDPKAVTLSGVLKAAGYDTACVGKWHLNGDGRSSFIPRERRHDFDYWKVLECTHDYNQSFYFGDDPVRRAWSGYDAFDQTRDACDYLRSHAKGEKPFLLWLAWGPPHNPYQTAPPKYRARYEPGKMVLRPNVPRAMENATRSNLAGYYAHCSALDDAIGGLLETLRQTGLATNTLFVFTSDHGDMLGSQGLTAKQKPFDESARVPMLIRLPQGSGAEGKKLDAPLNCEDLTPTLLGLCGPPIPKSMEGIDYSGYLRGGPDPGDGATVLLCAAPFGEWDRRVGGKEYRALRTTRYTYARDLAGPWLLFDNDADPYQTNNLASRPAQADLQASLDRWLGQKLKRNGDTFLPAAAYIKMWGCKVDANGTVPYAP